jgi:nucleotidyltransferase substrate binding protein (TIGR01987 family)
MAQVDIRWQQRFANYRNAFEQIDEAVVLANTRELSRLEKQGLIQAFEYTYELAWKTLKDYLQWQGLVDIIGSRDTIREAFSQGLLEDGQVWMNMLVDRNRTSHTYNQEIADTIFYNIRDVYHAHFKVLVTTLTKQQEKSRDSGN